jgi:hypothetical protein
MSDPIATATINPQQQLLQNQTRDFPRLYFLPVPDTLTQHLSPANDPLFHYSPCPIPLRQHRIQQFIQQEKERLLQLAADAKTAIIAVTRAAIRWLFWHIAVPLAVIASLYVAVANPAELPL